jgi:SAM-dependent methyltransferase
VSRYYNLTRNVLMNESSSNYVLDGWSTLYPDQRDYWINYIFSTIMNKEEVKSGVHRKQDWNDGWRENYVMQTLKPRYFGKYPVIRLGNELVTSEDSDFEYKTLCALESVVFEKYLKDCSSVYEFGCGTGHNLSRVKQVNKNCTLYGLDWSESAIACINSMVEANGIKFNMFTAHPHIRLDSDSVVLTVASMEQLGLSFHNFYDYIRSNRNHIKYVIHLEPLIELLDPSNLLDNLCIEYCKMRNYLREYLPFINAKARSGEVEIIECARTYVGSLFIEGYSLLVWKFI